MTGKTQARLPVLYLGLNHAMGDENGEFEAVRSGTEGNAKRGANVGGVAGRSIRRIRSTSVGQDKRDKCQRYSKVGRGNCEYGDDGNRGAEIPCEQHWKNAFRNTSTSYSFVAIRRLTGLCVLCGASLDHRIGVADRKGRVRGGAIDGHSLAVEMYQGECKRGERITEWPQFAKDICHKCLLTFLSERFNGVIHPVSVLRWHAEGFRSAVKKRSKSALPKELIEWLTEDRRANPITRAYKFRDWWVRQPGTIEWDFIDWLRRLIAREISRQRDKNGD